MRTLAFSVILLCAAGCASMERPKPLTGPEIVALHESGVPDEVLNYLQVVQIEEMETRHG